MWLTSRLAVARRSAELLDRRRHLLMEERIRRAQVAAETEEAWTAACLGAEEWVLRARTSGGEEQLQMAAALVSTQASVQLRWATVMGVLCAEELGCVLSEPGAVGALGSTAAFDEAAIAVGDAVAAGVRHAVARQALDAVVRDLAATARRLRVIEHRWIPQLEQTLAGLEVHLDELERDDHVRLRWVKHRIA